MNYIGQARDLFVITLQATSLCFEPVVCAYIYTSICVCICVRMYLCSYKVSSTNQVAFVKRKRRAKWGQRNGAEMRMNLLWSAET